MSAVKVTLRKVHYPAITIVTREKLCGDNRIMKKKRLVTHVRGVWFGTLPVLGAREKYAGVEDSILMHCMLGQGNSAVHS